MADEVLEPHEGRARDLGVRFRRLHLRFGRGQARLRLRDLVGGLALLEAQGGLRLEHLRRQPGGVLGVVGRLGLELVGGERGQHLVLLDDVALLDEQLGDLSRDLRADNDVVRGDDAREREGVRGVAGVGVGRAGRGHEEEQEKRTAEAIHDFKHMYKTCV